MKSSGITTLRLLDHGRRGFTLIELIVVIVVIGVLASLVGPNVFRHIGAAKETTAKSQIEMLGAALDAYRLDNGRYPTSDEGLAVLWSAPAQGAMGTSWRGPYTRKPVLADPWNHPYVYRSPGEQSLTGYDLLSHGADGHPGGTGEGSDITSWQ